MISLTCTLQKQAELLTSVGDDLVVKTMVPRFSTKVATPGNRLWVYVWCNRNLLNA